MNLHAPEAIFLAGLTSYLVVRAIYQRRAAGAQSAVKRSSTSDRLLVLLAVAGQVFVPLLYLFTPVLNAANYPAPAGSAWLGAVAWLAGMWIFWRSHSDLGRNWSVSLVVHQEHQSITNGVYRAVRHPMYSSFLLLGVAQALLLANWLAGPAALLAVAAMCAIRIPREEAMMSEYFGDAYAKYMLRTGRVVPRFGGDVSRGQADA